MMRKVWLAAAGLLVALYTWADPDALWHIVHDQCLPNLERTGTPAPCVKADLGQGEARGYIVLKDRKGVLQYLLIPSGKVRGIESPALLDPNAPDYWGAAWTARSYMSQKYGSEVPRDAVALTINSVMGRSQNQLHIHISCVRPAVRTLLAARQNEIGQDWSALDGGLNGHFYQVRRIEGTELTGVDPFKLLAAGVPGAANAMGDFTLAVIGTRFADGKDGFYLLAGKTDLTAGNTGSVEGDMQDHDCHVLESIG